MLCSQSLFHFELIQYFEVRWGPCLLIGGISGRVCQDGQCSLRGPLREAQCLKTLPYFGQCLFFYFLGAGYTNHFPHFPSLPHPPPPFTSNGLLVQFVQFALFQLLTIAPVNALNLMRLLVVENEC